MASHELVNEQIESLQNQINEMTSTHLRLRDEFDNLRKDYYHHLGIPQPESPMTTQGPEFPRETLRRT